LHQIDPRAKLLAALILLVAISTTPLRDHAIHLAFALLLAILILAAGLPFLAVIRRAAYVLPFSATFAFISWLSGDLLRALGLLEKSFLSACTLVLLVGTTRMMQLDCALLSLGIPRALVLVLQFLYRYLSVIADQAHRMTMAAQCRQGSRSIALRFRAASGAASVLFARSWERADGVYQAMLARGFSGDFHALSPLRFQSADARFLAGSTLLILLIRLAPDAAPAARSIIHAIAPAITPAIASVGGR
jgi:cobalt/nickel transport system permease protein